MAFTSTFQTRSEAVNAQGIGTFTTAVYGMYLQHVFKSSGEPPENLTVAIWSQTGSGGVNKFLEYTVNGDGTYTVGTSKSTLTPANLALEMDALGIIGYYGTISSDDFAEIESMLTA